MRYGSRTVPTARLQARHDCRYVHLTDPGRALVFEGDERYRELRLGWALMAVFSGWERADPPAYQVLAMRPSWRRPMHVAQTGP
jgi:hypothetical protein